MSQEKNSKKKPMIVKNFHFLVVFIRPSGPMVTMATRYTGGLSQLLLVETSREKKFMEKPMIEINYCMLVKFITPHPHLSKGGMGKKTFAKKA